MEEENEGEESKAEAIVSGPPQLTSFFFFPKLVPVPVTTESGSISEFFVQMEEGCEDFTS